MNRDQALAKIKKCLKLAKSDNPHEAGAAMRQAQALMAEFKITERDMSLADVNEVAIKAVCQAMTKWEAMLAKLVADAFACDQYSVHTSGLNASFNRYTKREYVFYGVDAAPTVAAYAFEVLSRQCAKARLAHIKLQSNRCKPITKTARGDHFAEGWVIGVINLVDRFASNSKNEQLLLDYKAAKLPHLKKAAPRDTTKGRRVESSHAFAGRLAAADAQLNRGVGGLVERALLQ